MKPVFKAPRDLFRQIQQLRRREKRSTFVEYLLRLGVQAEKKRRGEGVSKSMLKFEQAMVRRIAKAKR